MFKSMPSDRAGYLAAVAIIGAIKAADCLFDNDEPINQKRFRDELCACLRDNTTGNQKDNLIRVLSEIVSTPCSK